MKRSVRDWKVTVMGRGRCGRAILDRLLREGRPESAILNEFSSEGEPHQDPWKQHRQKDQLTAEAPRCCDRN